MFLDPGLGGRGRGPRGRGRHLGARRGADLPARWRNRTILARRTPTCGIHKMKSKRRDYAKSTAEHDKEKQSQE